jgi:hypothetical protein
MLAPPTTPKVNNSDATADSAAIASAWPGSSTAGISHRHHPRQVIAAIGTCPISALQYSAGRPLGD